LAYKAGDQWAKVHSSVFIGEPEDVPDERLGLFLMNTRESTKYVQYVGDIIRFDPAEYQDKGAVRRKLGYGTEHLVVCSVGGTGIGRPLLELCGQAYPLLKKDFPDLRMVLVGGPRIKPETLNPPAGVEVMGYVPNLHEHFAASDIAVVQCGGTTGVELLVLQKPFLYFPLELHSEQQLTVSGKMKAHGATLQMDFSGTTPETLAQAIKDNMGKGVHYAPLSIGGEKKIASIMSGMLGKP
jgi:predicted glycosyltransferase